MQETGSFHQHFHGNDLRGRLSGSHTLFLIPGTYNLGPTSVKTYKKGEQTKKLSSQTIFSNQKITLFSFSIFFFL